MILPIYTYGHPVLRRPTEEIGPDYPELKQLIADMFETLARADGVGLAAPQIGRSIRLFIVDGTELADTYPDCAGFKHVYINPEITEESEEETSYEEGCLSLPGISEKVRRPATITITYMDEDFNPHTETRSGFSARIIQHEYDHLQAHVFTDRISPLRRQMVSGKLNNLVKGKFNCRYKTKR